MRELGWTIVSTVVILCGLFTAGMVSRFAWNVFKAGWDSWDRY